MKISYTLGLKDMSNFAKEAFQKKSGIEQILLNSLFFMITYFPIFIIGLNFMNSINDQKLEFGEFWPSLFVAFPLFLLRFLIVPFFERKSYERSGIDGKVLTMELHPELLVACSEGIETRIKWTEFTHFTKAKNYAILWISQQNGLVIPFRAFHSESDKSAFLDSISSRVTSSH